MAAELDYEPDPPPSEYRGRIRLGAALLQVGALFFLLSAAIVVALLGVDFATELGRAEEKIIVIAGFVVEVLLSLFVGFALFVFVQWGAINLWRGRANWINMPVVWTIGIVGALLLITAAAGGVGTALRVPLWGRTYLITMGACLLTGAFMGAMATLTIRPSLGWANSRFAWQERIVNLTILVVFGTLVLLTMQSLSFWPAVLLWAIFLAAITIGTWQGWIKMFGPVLFYDMLRTARRNRYFIMRMLYAGFLFFILSYMVFITWVMEREFRVRQHAVIAETFFMVFMLVQLVVVVLLTPAYVAGAISDEKDRKTLEFMLATDLRNREIVLSKLLSRLGNMSLLLITGLPILSILQFIGGVDPELMLSGFAAIGLTMLGIGGLSILFSTLFKRPRDSITLTYLIMIAYGALATAGFGAQMSSFWLLSQPLWFNANAPTLSDIISALNAGNPIVVVFQLGNAIGGRRGASLAAVLPSILERYAWFHLSIAAISITWSIVRLRAIALKQTTAGETVKIRWWHGLFRPNVGTFPMLWKELFVESRTKLNWIVWMAAAVLVLLTLGTGVWVLGATLYEEFIDGGMRGMRGMGFRQHWTDQLGDRMNIWFRFAGTFVGTLLMLIVGVRASTCITNERERDTIDGLVMTPMSADGMLFAKLAGNLMGMRIGWLWFGSMLLLGVITFGIHPVGVPIILAGVVVYSVFMTMVGMAFSMYSRSSMQAAVFTVMTALLLGGGHWIITGCFCMPLFGAMMALLQMQFQVPHDVMESLADIGLYFVKFQAGLTPPFVFPWCSFSYRQFNGDWGPIDRHFWEFTGSSVLGLFIWGAASVALWFLVLVPKFRRVMRRIEVDDQ